MHRKRLQVWGRLCAALSRLQLLHQAEGPRAGELRSLLTSPPHLGGGGASVSRPQPHAGRRLLVSLLGKKDRGLSFT